MTKAQAVSEDKKGESEKIPAVTFYQKKEKHYEDTCWYTLSLITALVCCVPCGVVGLMNAMIAKQEALRDNEAGYRNRVRNAKVCTVVAVVFGLMTIASVAMLSFLFATTLVETHKLHESLNDALYDARSIGHTTRVYDHWYYDRTTTKSPANYRERLNELIIQHLNRDKEERPAPAPTPAPAPAPAPEEPWTTKTRYPSYHETTPERMVKDYDYDVYTTEQPLVTEEAEYNTTGTLIDSSTFSPTEIESFNATTAEAADKPSFWPSWL